MAKQYVVPDVIEPIMQKDAADCGVACLAMLLGVPYATVVASLPVRRRKAICGVEGLSNHQMLLLARKLGFVLKHIDDDHMPASAVAILWLQRPVEKNALNPARNKHEGHFVVYARGTIYNPAEGMWWMEPDAFFTTRRWEPMGAFVRVT